MNSDVRPIYDGIRVVGSALTVLCFPGDNITTHKALLMIKPGDVLVIDEGGYGTATFGHNMSLHARAAGALGVISSGTIRDLALLRRDKFPIFCNGVNPRSPQKNTPGSINVPVTVGGLVVNPGDIIVADDDGVAVVPLSIAEDIASKAAQRQKMEADQASGIDSKGERPLEILYGATWVDERLKGKVVEHHDAVPRPSGLVGPQMP
jgi:4-hydroxy-4-methyl-2-oxoglutarate aldolase